MSPHASCLQIARHLDALRATMRSIRPRLLVVALEEELVDQAQSARSAQKVRDQLKLRLLDIQLAHHPVVMPHVLLKLAGKPQKAHQQAPKAKPRVVVLLPWPQRALAHGAALALYRAVFQLQEPHTHYQRVHTHSSNAALSATHPQLVFGVARTRLAAVQVVR